MQLSRLPRSPLIVAALLLSACGGDDDGGPPAAEALSSDCAGSGQLHLRATYRVTGSEGSPYAGTWQEEFALGESAAFNGLNLLKQTQRSSFTLSAPADYAGAVLSDEQAYFYRRGDDFSYLIYASGNRSQWSGQPGIRYEEIYTPPYADPSYAALRPGQSVTIPVQGEQRVEASDGTTTRAINSTTTLLYHGQEEVQVPAGRFTACKYTYTYDAGGKRQVWIEKGSGMRIKLIEPERIPSQTGGTSTSELTAYQML